MESCTKEKVIVLLSGGLDSVVLAHHLTKFEGKVVVGLFFNYGQRFRGKEFDSCRDCIMQLRKEGFDSYLQPIYIENLTADEDGYNPARNLIFLSYAMRYAEQEGIKEIYAGFISPDDFSCSYPDTSKEFTANFNSLISPMGFNFYAPFLSLNKKSVYSKAISMNVDLDKLWSCNFPKINSDNGELSPCEECEDCLKKEEFLSSKSSLIDSVISILKSI